MTPLKNPVIFNFLVVEQKKIRIHLIISGIVQGVNFRYYTRETARKLNLTGWVKNLPDGRVEAIAEGEEKAIDEFIEWCKHGPPSARVDKVEAKKGRYTGEFRDFKIDYGWF